MAAFMLRGRSLKSRKLKGRSDSGEENVVLDYTKDPSVNLRETLFHLCNTDRNVKSKRLGYFNAFVRLCYRYGSSVKNSSVSDEDVLCCLRLGLLHDSKEMRAACLRALRYYCQTEETVEALLDLHIDYLIARSLDLFIDNEIERIHAMKLIRKLMQVSPDKFPQSLVNVVIAVAQGGAQEHDKMLKVCMATLCELAFYNPVLVCSRGGVSTLLKCVLECHQLPRINESLLTALLYLLNYPKTRHLIRSEVGIESASQGLSAIEIKNSSQYLLKGRVDQLLAPFTDSHFKYTSESTDTHLGSGEEEGVKYFACKMATSTLIKSWPGMIRLCKPDGSGVQSLIGVLFLPNMETRKEILELLFDVFRLPLPELTTEFAQALVSVDPSEMRDTWKLTEGFVAKEGCSLLQHIAQTRPNLVENHTALLLSAFISAGILEALVEVCTTSEDKVAVRATILLGEILHMAHNLLPYEVNYHSHCLPTLIDCASSVAGDRTRANQATLVIKWLDKLHSLKKRGPVPHSLFLDQIVQRARQSRQRESTRQSAGGETQQGLLNKSLSLQSFQSRKSRFGHMTCGPTVHLPSFKHFRQSAAWHHQPKQLQRLEHITSDSGEEVSQAIKDSQVLLTKDNLAWDWDLVTAILKWPDDNLKKLEDQSNQRFVKRLLYYYKPSNKLFVTLELSKTLSRKITLAGQHFLLFLLDSESDEARRYLKEWLGNVNACLEEIKSQRAPADAILSPQSMYHMCSRYYFLYLGCLSASTLGDKLLQNMGIYQSLLDLVGVTSHDSFVKIIVSSLDYSREGATRSILSKALTATSDICRLYSVQMLRVLLRTRAPFFGGWGIEMLVLQLYDKVKAVAMEALTILSEACEDESHLLQLIKLRPSVLHLGHKGSLLLARFLSMPPGFKFLMEASYVEKELDKWHKEFNKKYVEIVEERLNEALTTYEKTYDGSYVRRTHRRVARVDVFVPIHLYGQLVQHKDGFSLLTQQSYLTTYFDMVKYQVLRSEQDVLKLKEAIWVTGHIGTSVWGLGLLEEHALIADLIKLAEESGVFSIRGTAFYALGLIASTSKGASILTSLGWECVRHKRTERWPVSDEVMKPGPFFEQALRNTELPTSVSRVSLCSSTRSEGLSPLVTNVPSVTLHPPNDEEGSEDYSPSVQALGGKPLFFIDDDAASSGKSRANTLETLSEHVDSDADQEVIVYSRNGESSENTDNDNDPENVDTTEVIIESDPDSTKDAQGLTKTKSLKKDVGLAKSKNVIKIAAANSEVKSRSSSTPSEYERSKAVIHPRTKSDPRGMNEKRLANQVMVHFNDLQEGEKTVTLRSNNVLAPSDGGKLPLAGGSVRARSPMCMGISEEATSSSSQSEQMLSSIKSRSGSHHSSTTPDSAFSPGGSSDSDHGRVGLSPIASADSVQTDEAIHVSRNSVHHSEAVRRMANLKRVPSTKRRFSNPVLTPILKTIHNDTEAFKEYTLTYSSLRDIQGLATLRDLKRQRTESLDLERERLPNSLSEDPNTVMKTKSLDFRTLGRLRRSMSQKLRRPKFSFRTRKPHRSVSETNECSSRNLSSTSLQEMDVNTPPSSPTDPYPTTSSLHKVPTLPYIRKPRQESTGRPEYMGICLPVDITMVFQVHEGEDPRSQFDSSQLGQSCKPVYMKKRRASGIPDEDDGLEHHRRNMCLGCYRVRNKGQNESVPNVTSEDDESYQSSASQCESQPASAAGTPVPSQAPSPADRGLRRGVKSRQNSLSEMAGSVTSTVSMEGAKPVMSEDTLAGRVLIRKEVLKFVVSLASSVGTKNSEQGLLVLKQKFPGAFSDVCLYSEICYLLANYNYRLTARRFIQELFMDANFIQMHEEPAQISSELAAELGLSQHRLSDTHMKLDLALESIS